MMLLRGHSRGRAIALFPYLKTTGRFTLAGFEFRSTDDLDGVNEEDRSHIREVCDMLFLQDDLIVKSATYCLLSEVDLDENEALLSALQNVQTIIAYFYGSPSPAFDAPFLAPEHASMVILSPEPVSIFLVHPDQHVRSLSSYESLVPDDRQHVPGYYGRYNFRHALWVVKQSRIYPPVPHLTLNISQDLAADLAGIQTSPRFHLLPELLSRSSTEMSERVFNAMSWYNRANSLSSTEHSAILDLSIAFETVFALPKDAKTSHFVDSISLLLGRVTRLNEWAHQFYEARSAVVHEGKAVTSRFTMPKIRDRPQATELEPLLSYGRQIFQLCTATLLFGAELGHRAGLEERFVTNQERIELICRTLTDGSLNPSERFGRILEPVMAFGRYRYSRETGLRIDGLVGAAQCAARVLLLTGEPLDTGLEEKMSRLADAKADGNYEALAALESLYNFRLSTPPEHRSPVAITLRLLETVWHHTSLHYFWQKEQMDRAKSSETGAGDT